MPSLPPLEGGQRALGTFAVALATFMNVLDSAIANVSIPAIAGDLGVSPAQGTWVITSFGVATAISVPLTGWLSQRIGQARLFVACVILFVSFSWLWAFSAHGGILTSLATVLLETAIWEKQAQDNKLEGGRSL